MAAKKFSESKSTSPVPVPLASCRHGNGRFHSSSRGGLDFLSFSNPQRDTQKTLSGTRGAYVGLSAPCNERAARGGRASLRRESGVRCPPRGPGGASRDWRRAPPSSAPAPHLGSALDPAGWSTPRDPQDARGQDLLPRPHAMEEEAAGAPHGQPDLPAPAAAPDRGRHPTGHGEREAGGRARFHVSEPAHSQGEPSPRPSPSCARPLTGHPRGWGFPRVPPRPHRPAPSAALGAPALVQTDVDPRAVTGRPHRLAEPQFPHPQSGMIMALIKGSDWEDCIR